MVTIDGCGRIVMQWPIYVAAKSVFLQPMGEAISDLNPLSLLPGNLEEHRIYAKAFVKYYKPIILTYVYFTVVQGRRYPLQKGAVR